MISFNQPVAFSCTAAIVVNDAFLYSGERLLRRGRDAPSVCRFRAPFPFALTANTSDADGLCREIGARSREAESAHSVVGTEHVRERSSSIWGD